MTGLGIKVKYIQNGTKSITVHFLITEKYQSIQPKKNVYTSTGLEHKKLITV